MANVNKRRWAQPLLCVSGSKVNLAAGSVWFCILHSAQPCAVEDRRPRHASLRPSLQNFCTSSRHPPSVIAAAGTTIAIISTMRCFITLLPELEGLTGLCKKKHADRSRLRFASRFSLQLLDRGFSLVLGQLLLKTLCGFLEAGIAVKLFGAAQ